jgi:hypothetical protein
MKSFVSKLLLTAAALSTLIGAQVAYAQQESRPLWQGARAVHDGASLPQTGDEGVCRWSYSGGPKNPATC